MNLEQEIYMITFPREDLTTYNVCEMLKFFAILILYSFKKVQMYKNMFKSILIWNKTEKC